MNILITGSTGFIGKNLLRQLSDEGDAKVYAICRKELIGFKADNVKFIETDLSQKNWLQNVPGEIDVVVYLAQSYRYREFPDGAEDKFKGIIDVINEQYIQYADADGMEYNRIPLTPELQEKTKNASRSLRSKEKN